MKVLRDQSAIASISDPALHALIEQRVQSLAEYDDYELHELVTFIVVEPGDTLGAIDTDLGFSIPGGTFELLEEHPGWYEIVFVVSDGFGWEVFIPKDAGVDAQLIEMCAANATPAADA